MQWLKLWKLKKLEFAKMSSNLHPLSYPVFACWQVQGTGSTKKYLFIVPTFLNYLNPMLCLIYLIGLYIKVKHIYVGIFSDVPYDLVSLTTTTDMRVLRAVFGSVQVLRHHKRPAILLYVRQTALFFQKHNCSRKHSATKVQSRIQTNQYWYWPLHIQQQPIVI